jgi:hypothetical protein
MQIRQDRKTHRPRPAAAGNGPARHGGRLVKRWLPFLSLLALAVVAITAPAGQARAGSESSEAGALAAPQKAAEREERASARKAQRESEKAAAKSAKPHSPRSGSSSPVGITNGANSIQIGCTSVVWEFHQFPSGQNNTVSEKVTFIKKGSEPVSSKSTFTFAGDSGTNTTPIDAPAGTYTIDAEARWAKSPQSEGRSGFDLHAKVECGPNPAMTVVKLQKLEVAGSSYVTTPLTGEPGQTVDYQILVDNTGNVPLALSDFTDPHCEENTITGGPAGGILAANATTEYLCRHVLTANDLTVGKYENTVQVTGTPTEYVTTPLPPGVSNTVETTVVPVGTQPSSGGGGTDPAGGNGSGTNPAPTTTATGKGATSGGKTGVLGFSAASVPALKGPQGCVRSSFHVSIKSAGVASVIFYLDSHKLKKLTYHNARKGLLSIAIGLSKLKVGAHRLVADITMKATVTNAKAAKAARSLTVLRCRSNVVTPKFTG